MDEIIRTHLKNLFTSDPQLQNKAFSALIEATEQPVDWAYEVWDDLLAGLKHKDNHVRAITSQVLCNLARSDPEQRMLKDFDALLAVTRDERFVTARHCLQALWKISLAGPPQRQRLVEGLELRFKECVTEKNATLIRYDILQSLRNVYDQSKDASLRQKALQWIEMETDSKYRKKYATLWRVP